MDRIGSRRFGKVELCVIDISGVTGLNENMQRRVGLMRLRRKGLDVMGCIRV